MTKRRERMRDISGVQFIQNGTNYRAINRTRTENNLPIITLKTKLCLRCDKEFESHAVNHRLCNNCKDYANNTDSFFTDEIEPCCG